MRKKYFVLPRFFTAVCFCACAVSAISETPEQYTKTAVHCISTAKNLFAQAEYEKAYAQASLGLTYDDTVADLYYLQALSLSVRGMPPYMVEPSLSASLKHRWYEYNRDAGRLLLADLYTKTGRAESALVLLDEQPSLSGKDALYIRSRALYLSGNAAAARRSITQAVSRFPEDERFALLFFDCEKSLDGRGDDENFKELVLLFLQRAAVLQDVNPDVLLKASFFSSGENKKRLLKAWNAYGKRNPLYAVYALQAGLLNEKTAFDYMLPFLSGTMEYDCLKSFVSLISHNEVKERIYAFYTAFTGNIVFDTDEDGIADMKVQYRLGRPSVIEYDKNQDGKLDWTADCDYGVPVKLQLFNENIILWYGVWPAIARVVYGSGDSAFDSSHSKKFAAQNASGTVHEVYTVRENSLFGTPVNMVKDDIMEKHGGTVLYVPVLQNDLHAIDTLKETLFTLSHTVERKTGEYENSFVRFGLFDGKMQNAVYTDRGTPYAYAFFENGMLRFRNVDRDKNGSYEITEVYGFDPVKATEYRSAEEELQMGCRLFGDEKAAKGLYLQKIISDTDGTSRIVQEYGPAGKTVLSWIDRQTGSRNIRYVRHSETSEEIEYSRSFDGVQVKLVLEKGVPVSVNGFSVIKDPDVPFYWIGEYPGREHAKKAMEMLNRKASSGVIASVTDLIWFKEKDRFFKIFAVKNGDVYFGEVLYE